MADHMPLHRLLSLAFLFLAACGAQPSVIELSGETMGTTYNVTVVDWSRHADEEALRLVIEETLVDVNARFSNWDPGSEVSRFNAQATTEPVAVSASFLAVMDAADQVHRATQGQFDVTLGPLVELWGFGAPGPNAVVPSDDAIARAMAQIGQLRVLSSDAGASSLQKELPSATIYLAALAKGRGVDEVADALSARGHEHFMVEIGGDLFAAGENPRGASWRIGIEKPDVGQRMVEEIVALTDLGMATSGDYRNYFEEDGVRYSHILDAETGRPVTHTTASVTVLAETAMLADAWATGLLALGSERGLMIAEEHNIAALFIVRGQDPTDMTFQHVTSSAFDALFAEQEN